MGLRPSVSDRGGDEVIGRRFVTSLVWMLVVAVLAGCAAFVGFRWWGRPATPPQKSSLAGTSPFDAPPTITPPKSLFTDITQEAGIDFIHVSGREGQRLFPETMGSGCAMFDCDGDDDLDILLVNSNRWSWSKGAEQKNPPTPALYLNDGNGHFENATASAGLNFSLYGQGVAVGDYDNDGDQDLYITALGPNKLLRNDGQGHFEDVTVLAGVEGGQQEWNTSCGWFDYDNDGDLDLFVCTYVKWTREIDAAITHENKDRVLSNTGPREYEGTYCRLYRNEGDSLFSDVSKAAGIRVVNRDNDAPVGKSLGVCFTDLDRDGWLDVVVANDTVRNFVFHNRRDGTFHERGADWRIAFGPQGDARAGMGIDIADFRGNGTLGVAIGNYASEMTALFVSQAESKLVFTDEAIVAGIGPATRVPLTFGVVFFDYDLDGRLDLLQTNGHIEPDIHLIDSSQTFAQRAQLFWNCGPEHRGDFVEAKAEQVGSALFEPLVGRGIAYGDIDGDGDLDVLLSANEGRPRLLRNDQNHGHHWLRLKLIGQRCNRDAVGARVVVTIGQREYRRVVMPTRGYLSQVEPTVTFGLGKNERVDEVRVIWPGGNVQKLTDVKIDKVNVVRQSDE